MLKVSGTPASMVFPSAGQVDVWLRARSASDQLDSGLLSDPEEVKRCEQLVLPERRQQYIFAHLSLHLVLRAYLGAYVLQQSPQGKPFIATTYGPGLEFSMSHAGSMCAIAISTQEVGIDIEIASPRIKHGELMENYFPDYQLPQEAPGRWDPHRAGIVAWCHFESSVKLEGETLHDQLWNRVGPLWYEHGHSHVVLVQDEAVCVLAQRQPFRVSGIWKIA